MTSLSLGCGSAPEDEDPDDPIEDGELDTDDLPVDVGTVEPPVDIGVGGGEPVDNLNPDIGDGDDDIDGDGLPG